MQYNDLGRYYNLTCKSFIPNDSRIDCVSCQLCNFLLPKIQDSSNHETRLKFSQDWSRLDYNLISISCQHCRSSRNNLHYAPRSITYYYFSLMPLYYILKVATGGEMKNFVLSDTRFNFKLLIYLQSLFTNVWWRYLSYAQDLGK